LEQQEQSESILFSSTLMLTVYVMEARFLYDNREKRGLVSDPLSFGSAARAYVADWMVRLVVDDNIEKKSKPCQLDKRQGQASGRIIHTKCHKTETKLFLDTKTPDCVGNLFSTISVCQHLYINVRLFLSLTTQT
jgi:hypothetical protein